MYAAHAEKKRKESSQTLLDNCISQLQQASSDTDRFNVVLEITECVQTHQLTEADRATVLGTMGFDFLSTLITATSGPADCPKDMYKAMALSVLAVVCVEPQMATSQEMTKFLPEVNASFSSFLNDTGKQGATPAASPIIPVCEDCISICQHMAQHPQGIQMLAQCGTIPLLLEMAISNCCLKQQSVLSIISCIMRSRGDIVFQGREGQFHTIMNMAVDGLVACTDMTGKATYARILISLLNGMNLIEADSSTDWVVKLAQCLKKLLIVKLNAESSEALILLTCGLVSAVGPAVLGAKVTGDTTFLKTVVARLSVEVYVKLDCLNADNAMERYPTMDKVYKMVSTVVQYVCEGDEANADTDTIIAVYRKLVDVSKTIMEFLYSVANQEMDLTKNHVVVLLSVRTLAAMLTEITEAPTQTLLELLPFFNLLCQNVEYSDDVQMEVKNLMQASLANIKNIGFTRSDMVIEDQEEEKSAPQEYVRPKLYFEPTSLDSSDLLKSGNSSKSSAVRERLQELNSSENVSIPTIQGQNSSAKNNSSKKSVKFVENKSVNNFSEGATQNLTMLNERLTDVNLNSHSVNGGEVSMNGDTNSNLHIQGINSRSTTNDKHNTSPLSSSYNKLDDSHSSSSPPCDHKHSIPDMSARGEHKQSMPSISLDMDCIDRYNDFINSLRESQSKPSLLRQSSFLGKAAKKKQNSEAKQNINSEEMIQWHPKPDDVLGFVLPTYAFLLEHEDALKVMVKCDAFQTIVNFIEKSLSQFLEDESTVFPETSTSNALGVIQQVYSANPSIAAGLDCFQDLFEISMMSVPNLVSLPHPPALVCLRLMEVALVAYRSQMKGGKRNSALPRLKHSRSRFFKTVVDYLPTFYSIRQSRRRQTLVLSVKRHCHAIWPGIEEAWCACVAGLCDLIKGVDDLQDALVKSLMVPEFLAFVRENRGQISGQPDTDKLISSMVNLVESCAEGSPRLGEMVLQNHGMQVASMLGLQKLSKNLKLQSKASSQGKGYLGQ